MTQSQKTNKKTEAIAVSNAPVNSKEIIPQEQSIANFNVESLMAKAIEHGLSPETMEKFLAMRQQLKAEWAREQFNKAMAAFQSECPTIVKTKEVKTKSGVVAYRYAPIESIVSQVKDLLQKHGFSYSNSMEVLPEGVKVCVKVTHKDGHSEENCMQVPLGTKTDIMSQSQVTAAAQTFAKRYAFCNSFGIMTGDEDTDARPQEPQYTHGGEIVEKPRQAKSIPPSEKQLDLIDKLLTQKGFTEEDIYKAGFDPKTLTGGKEGTASELIDRLMKAKPKVVVDDPIGDQLDF